LVTDHLPQQKKDEHSPHRRVWIVMID